MSKKGLVLGGCALLLSCIIATPAFAGSWQYDGYHWTYYNDSAQLVTGWVKDGDYWYYMNSAGHMMTGWIKDEDKWYFLYDNGIMAAETWIDNYYVNGSGVWTQTR